MLTPLTQLTQGQYKIEYSPDGIIFTINVIENQYSFVINDISLLKQLIVIIETFIKRNGGLLDPRMINP